MRSGTHLRKTTTRPNFIAEVTLRVYGTEPGNSEITVEVAKEGDFSGARGGHAARADAYTKLLRVAQRELREGLVRLSSF